MLNFLLRAPSKINSFRARNLSLLEHQSKKILQSNGIEVPDFCVVDLKSGINTFENFKAANYMVKAQIPAGGRGRGHFDNGFKGGVQLTRHRHGVEQIIDKMLGYKLITEQTNKEGMRVSEVMISEAVMDVEKEAYFSIALDPTYPQPLVIVSSMGSVNIEKVAQEHPLIVHKIPVHIYDGISYETALNISKLFGFRRENHGKAAELLVKLWNIFVKLDILQIEINPLIQTKSNKITCLDCKINIDNNAKFRHKDIFNREEEILMDSKIACKNNLNYIGLNGDIGCMVNGAGLAMATMDLIKVLGGEPANFMDISGNANSKQISTALSLLTNNPKVKVIFINVFGGLLSCKSIAYGIVNAADEESFKTPIVARLEGTHVKEAMDVLENCDAKIIYVDSMEQGVKEVIRISKEKNSQLHL